MWMMLGIIAVLALLVVPQGEGGDQCPVCNRADCDRCDECMFEDDAR